MELADRHGRSGVRGLGREHERGRDAAQAPEPVPVPLVRRTDDRRRPGDPRRRLAVGAPSHRFRDRTGTVGAHPAHRGARLEAREEQLCVGDPGHRRRARVRLPGLRRPVRLRPRRQPALAPAGGDVPDASGLGHRVVTGPARRPPLPRERQPGAVVPRRLQRQHRGGALAGRPGRGLQLGHPLRLGERPADRDRDHRHGGRAVLRSRRQPALGADGHVVDSRRDAVRPSRPAVRQLRLHRRLEPAGLRHPPGRRGRHHAGPGRIEQRVHSPGPIRGWARTTPRPSSTATTTTSSSTAASSSVTTRAPARRSIPGSGSRGAAPCSPHRPGPTTAASSP